MRPWMCAAVLALAGCGGGGGGGDGGKDPRLVWRYEAAQGIYYPTPALAGDGSIVVTTGVEHFGSNRARGTLLSLSPDGKRKWEVALESSSPFAPVIGPDGTIYLQDHTGSLSAFTAAGALKWKLSKTAPVDLLGITVPALAADGTIVFGADGLYAANPDGMELWRMDEIAGPVRTAPAIAADGTIYVAGRLVGRDPIQALWAVRPDGTVKWRSVLNGTLFAYSSPAIGPDGTVYCGGETQANDGDSFVYAVRPDGTQAWRFTLGPRRNVRSSPAIGSDGTIYVGTTKWCDQVGGFLALAPDGSEKWTFDVDDPHCEADPAYVPSSPTLGADGTVYFGSAAYLYAVAPDGKLVWKTQISGFDAWSSAALAADGTLYIGGFDWDGRQDHPSTGTLWAVRSDSPGLAAAPWPKFHKDASNAGRF